MRLLIAEDDAVTRLQLTATIERMGHEAIAAPDGGQAWEGLPGGVTR
jgi:CheY-like chemotaxis protein